MSTPQPPGGGYAPSQEHPQGTLILILGILGFVTSGVCGLIAWIMGSKAQKEIEASGVSYSNEGNIKIGKILGMITTILAIVGIVITIIAVIATAVLASSATTY